jgi:hypothetical protein
MPWTPAGSSEVSRKGSPGAIIGAGMRGDVRAGSDALITRAMAGIRQKVANLRHNRLDPKKWCVFVGSCEATNVRGLAFAQRFSPQHVPVGSDQIFLALLQTQDVVDALAAIGAPEQLRQDIQRAAAGVADGSVTVVCSVTKGVTVAHLALEDLPPPEPTSRLVEIPAVGRRRLALLQANLPAIGNCYAQILKEGLDPGSVSVIVLDPNSNAMGLRLIEEVEANDALVSQLRAEADLGKAATYFNFAKNDQLGPAMSRLKIEVDGAVKDSAISAPVRPENLRVLVCTENGASSFDIDRPRKVAGPGVPTA